MTEKIDILERYVDRLWPAWRAEVPLLLSYFHPIQLEAGEYLSSQRGDIYFVSSGLLGKYSKQDPLRYIAQRELIIVPLKPSSIHFRSLTATTAFLLERSQLYKILEQFPRSIILYDELLIKQQQSIDFRYTLLQLPKADRLEKLRAHYPKLEGLLSRSELAAYLRISKEYLRRHL